MLVVAAIVIVTTLYSGRLMDRVSLQNQQELVDNSFSNRLKQGLSELRGVAWWDDVVTKTATGAVDTEWLNVEVGGYMVESNKHSRIIIVDEANSPIYSYGEKGALKPSHIKQHLADLKPIIEQARGGPNVSPRLGAKAPPGELYEWTDDGRKHSRGFGGLATIDGKPAIAMAMLITPSDETAKVSPVRRLVLSVIDVTPELIASFGRQTMITDLGFQQPLALKGGSLALKADTGTSHSIANIGWTPKRPGTEMVRRLLPMIVVALLIAGVLMVVLMRKLLSSTASLASREREAQHLANHDALTGLPNRRKLELELFMRAGRANSSPTRLAVAVVDLDRFKDINDTLGHHAGDDLIRSVGERLRQNLRADDFIARLGGDEFAILRECKELADADQLSSTIASAFATPFAVTGHQIEANASVGMAIAGYERAIEDLVREADIALYEAKDRGRGCTVRFAPAMAKRIEERRSLEIDLKIAIANKALTMHYQPIVEAATGIVSSVEALVRWQCPKHGNVGPDIFVPIAEETGMMADLGRFVIEQAIEDSKRWPQLSTAINISPAQLRSSSILHDLIEPTKRHGVSPKNITIEITESVLMANDQRTLRTLNILKDSGFSIALDDFGSGYSSLAYVRDFPFDRLKIDRSFVTGLDDTSRSVEIVKAVVNFGKILGRDVVAEGIETEQEMQAMQAAGVTHLQGYLFSRPLSAAHVEAMVNVTGRLTASRTTERNVEHQSAIAPTASQAKIRRVV